MRDPLLNRRLVLTGAGALLAGCASPAPLPPTLAGQTTTPTIAPPSTPPPPVPPPPPEAAAYLAGEDPPLMPTGDPVLDAWIARVFEEGGAGWRPYLLRAFQSVAANPAALVEAQAWQAQRRRAPIALLREVVTPERVAEGRRRYRQIGWAGTPKVPVEVLLAIWGAETDFGRRRPRFDLVEAIANAEAHGLGRGFGEFDIYEAVTLLALGKVDRVKARAFGDGRMGQLAWYPDTYLRWGADGDGDGRIDIWDGDEDIFACLLGALPGWETGLPWAVEVIAPPLDGSDPMQLRMARSPWRPLSAVRRADGRAWTLAEQRAGGGDLIAPFGRDGPSFLAFRNLMPLGSVGDAVNRYDQAAVQAWGVAVGQLANEIAGAPPLTVR
ncbi:lytic murein transglycosylase [Phenylobacterium sp.]|jgi:membrane-bound lytic murein transglycosylase B|uniref:lytic murein transglycosylase n=1 Tax=Phenylobacterium sp. TaxID=1871053 RepID=UPI002E36A4EC|nr:lytic murein transglycosylase [Phenylobacterium sp.]HEX2561013.1 lytic murein transglycosylase [Phenylobacterium sp.]